MEVALKTAKVDEEMVPLVEWLNSFDSVHTLACCQGELGKGKAIDEIGKPYVLFFCFDSLELIKVLHELRFIRGDVKVEIEWDERRAALIYVARWPNREALLDTIEYLTY